MIGIPWVKPAGVASARATAGRGERWDSSWPTVLLFRSGGSCGRREISRRFQRWILGGNSAMNMERYGWLFWLFILLLLLFIIIIHIHVVPYYSIHFHSILDAHVHSLTCERIKTTRAGCSKQEPYAWMVYALASFLDDATPRSTRSTPRGVTGIASAPKMGNWITQAREIEKPVAQISEPWCECILTPRLWALVIPCP